MFGFFFCTGDFKFPHHTRVSNILDHCWLRTSCDVTSPAHRLKLKLRISMSAEKLSTFSRWMWKQPSSVKLCTYIILHTGTQKSNCRNKKKKWRGTLKCVHKFTCSLFWWERSEHFEGYVAAKDKTLQLPLYNDIKMVINISISTQV